MLLPCTQNCLLLHISLSSFLLNNFPGKRVKIEGSTTFVAKFLLFTLVSAGGFLAHDDLRKRRRQWRQGWQQPSWQRQQRLSCSISVSDLRGKLSTKQRRGEKRDARRVWNSGAIVDVRGRKTVDEDVSRQRRWPTLQSFCFHSNSSVFCGSFKKKSKKWEFGDTIRKGLR